MNDATPAQQLNGHITAYWHAQAVYVAAKLKIADLLVDRPQTAEQLAEATSTHPRALYRLLRALASLGVFEEQSELFALTPVGEGLISDAPGSQWASIIMLGEEHYQACGELLYSVQTEKPSFDKIYGRPFFEFLSENPDKAAIFDAAMVGIHGRETTDILEAYDFGNTKAVADIGGGNGSMLAKVLEAYPDMHGTLFDLPGVLDRAKDDIEKAGLTNRVHLVAGDFFASIPGGAETYMLRHIIHDWDDDRAIRILQNVYAAMEGSGRLLILESVIPPGNDRFFGKFLDLTMLTIPGGRERTAEEYEQILAAANFRLSRIIPTTGELSIVEGIPQ